MTVTVLQCKLSITKMMPNNLNLISTCPSRHLSVQKPLFQSQLAPPYYGQVSQLSRPRAGRSSWRRRLEIGTSLLCCVSRVLCTQCDVDCTNWPADHHADFSKDFLLNRSQIQFILVSAKLCELHKIKLTGLLLFVQSLAYTQLRLKKLISSVWYVHASSLHSRFCET